MFRNFCFLIFAHSSFGPLFFVGMVLTLDCLLLFHLCRISVLCFAAFSFALLSHFLLKSHSVLSFSLYLHFVVKHFFLLFLDVGSLSLQMLEEVKAAAGFITGLPNTVLDGTQREAMRVALMDLMRRKYANHWNESSPLQGNGYRSIMTCGSVVDPLILAAAQSAGVKNDVISTLFPSDLIVWVDPNDVSYRFGENGSISQLYPAESNTPLTNGRETPSNAITVTSLTGSTPTILGITPPSPSKLPNAIAVTANAYRE